MFEKLIALAERVALDPSRLWMTAVEQVRDPARVNAVIGNPQIALVQAEAYASKYDPLISKPRGTAFTAATLAYVLAESRQSYSGANIGWWAVDHWLTWMAKVSPSDRQIPVCFLPVVQHLLDHWPMGRPVGDRIWLLVDYGHRLLQVEDVDLPTRQEEALSRFDAAVELLPQCPDNKLRIQLSSSVHFARADLRVNWYFGDRQYQLDQAVDDYEQAILAYRQLGESLLEIETRGHQANVYLSIANLSEIDNYGVRQDAIEDLKQSNLLLNIESNITKAFQLLDAAQQLHPTNDVLPLFRANALSFRASFNRQMPNRGTASADIREAISLLQSWLTSSRYRPGMERQAAKVQSDLTGLRNLLYDIDRQTILSDSDLVDLSAADQVFQVVRSDNLRLKLLNNLGIAYKNRQDWVASFDAFRRAVVLLSDQLRTNTNPIINHHRLAYLHRQADLTEKLIYLSIQTEQLTEAVQWSEWSAAFELTDLLRVRRVLERVTTVEERQQQLRRIIDCNERGHLLEEASVLWGRAHRYNSDCNNSLDRSELNRLEVGSVTGSQDQQRRIAAQRHRQLLSSVTETWSELLPEASCPTELVEKPCEVAARAKAALLYITPSRWGTSAVLALPNHAVGYQLRITRQQIADVLDEYQRRYHGWRKAHRVLREASGEDLVAARAVEEDVREQWHATLAGEDTSLVEQLSARLWSPLRQWLASHYPGAGAAATSPVPHLYLVARGGLAHVPFHALFSLHQAGEEKLIADDEYILSMVPSAAHLRACLDRHAPSDGKLLLVVDQTLPGAKDEANRVSSSFGWQATRAASRADVEREWPNCSAALFATHARHDLRSPWMRTSVDISENEQLFIADILRMPLMGTTVFSGCETASGGSLSDSEHVTLTAAALNAGCRSSVGSLWCADDDANTAQIIGDFFAHLRDDPTRPSQALWRARRVARQREVARARQDNREQEVHTWATFVAYGV